MSKARLSAFVDAVLAIIMTILVLELERPEHVTLEALWDLRMNFFAYTVSFFWLGTMWINIHNEWYYVSKVGKKTVWWVMLLLFFSSLFPYATSLVSSEFNNSVAQVFYGVVVLLVTFTNTLMYRSVSKDNRDSVTFVDRIQSRSNWIWYDIACKIVGIILSATIFPAAMMITVLLTVTVLVIPKQLKKEQK
jgi:uncharacterized membrane protein